ncbi:Delta(12) acyl-lipid conjugase (11E,13E-forming) [Seminavis robusta]|uniref:Delta(12) acyl-lipid conjugase (11E,13E-forming) n=1 Tax=Seminavis robusta TaxID=568900 RepID=A0A9N8H4H5_9STRA|nr:Delta(12) acyl-lipid conjugase (11E,13E-forming) [Seminavis robusta]|eukprot:Sro8_g006890.1 Delta(12) acyl-lipid conjugase (11E,13E-forming) (503) ;mRNA; r:225981-227489
MTTEENSEKKEEVTTTTAIASASSGRTEVYEKQKMYIRGDPAFEWVSPFSPDRVDPLVSKKVVEFPTRSELKAVIPPHCFERSLFWSFFYVIRDIVQGIIVVYLTTQVFQLSTEPPQFEENASIATKVTAWLAWRLAWNIYAGVMAAAAGGLWVIGHECGHGAFSDYQWVNGLVGWTLHSAMLVPYFSWAFSHAKHHRRTNDMEDGETHVPCTYQDVGLLKQSTSAGTSTYQRASMKQVQEKMVGSGGLYQVLSNFFYANAQLQEMMGDEFFSFCLLYFRLFFLFQFYLMGAKADGKVPKTKGNWEDHFRPQSDLFPPKMKWKVIASDIGCGITISILAVCSYFYGFRAVWFWYFGPYTHIHMFLVGVTWLQHTDPTIPHFDEQNWTWMVGALAGTIDRPMYGWVNYGSHNICTTHVVHHCFHTIPHYRALEATKAIRDFLEPKGLYNYDPTPVEHACFKIAKRCHFVDSHTDGVQYYQSLMDVPKSTTTSAANTANKEKQN